MSWATKSSSGLHAHAAGAAAALLAIDGDGRALEVALVGDGDGHLLVGDEVFKLDFGGLVDDGGAAGVAVAVANVFQLLDDDFAELLVGGEDFFVLGNSLADFGELVENFVHRELGEAIELQLEDGVDLAEGDAALFSGQPLAIEVDDDIVALAPGVEAFASLGARAGPADDADDGVEIVEGDFVAFEDVLAFAGFAQQVDGAALDHVDTMIDERADRLIEAQFARLAVEHGQENHGEAFLELGVLIELVEYDFRLRAAL